MADRPCDAAQNARLIARAAPSGALATRRRARRTTGHPYVSKVALALDMDGAVLFLFSTLAAHTQDLLADGRCSLLVEAPAATSNPLESARATLMGRAQALKGDAAARARARYLAVHPAAARYVDFGDFAFWRLEVDKVHFVGGFGRAEWAKGGDYVTFPGDLTDKGEALLDRLNTYNTADLDYLAGDGHGWRAVSVDPDGLTLTEPRGARARVDFPSPAKSLKTWRARFARRVRR